MKNSDPHQSQNSGKNTVGKRARFFAENAAEECKAILPRNATQKVRNYSLDLALSRSRSATRSSQESIGQLSRRPLTSREQRG